MKKIDRYYLMHKDTQVCSLQLLISPADVYVMNVDEIYEHELLPKEAIYLNEESGRTMADSIYLWLHTRLPEPKTDPFTRDEQIIEILGLQDSAHNNGRLTRLENVIALLNHYKTDYDDYSLVPAEPTTIYFPYYIGWGKVFIDIPEEEHVTNA